MSDLLWLVRAIIFCMKAQEMSTQTVTYENILAALRRVPINQLNQVYEYLLDLQEDADDMTAIREARAEYEHTGDLGISLDEYIHMNDLLEEVDAAAKADGLIVK